MFSGQDVKSIDLDCQANIFATDVSWTHVGWKDAGEMEVGRTDVCQTDVGCTNVGWMDIGWMDVGWKDVVCSRTNSSPLDSPLFCCENREAYVLESIVTNSYSSQKRPRAFH